MLGFVTAMETFCGQAHGARRYVYVGIVLQRGLAISCVYSAVAVAAWRHCEAALLAMGQVTGLHITVQITHANARHQTQCRTILYSTPTPKPHPLLCISLIPF